MLRERIRDGVKIADTLRENEAKQNEERRGVLDRRAAAMVAERIRQSHLTFAREFVCQQNSVSQALRSHDRAEVKKDNLKRLSDAVRAERECHLQKKALVRKYMEHRRLINQAEVSFGSCSDGKVDHEFCPSNRNRTCALATRHVQCVPKKATF